MSGVVQSGIDMEPGRRTESAGNLMRLAPDKSTPGAKLAAVPVDQLTCMHKAAQPLTGACHVRHGTGWGRHLVNGQLK